MPPEPIKNKQDLQKLVTYFLKKNEVRNYLLIVMGVYTALRISDLLKLKWADVYDFRHQHFKKTLTLTERKTGKYKQIALNNCVIEALNLYFNTKAPGIFIFDNGRQRPLTRTHAWRIISKAVATLDIQGKITCHSLRKTLGYHAWKKGTQPVLLMELYNHSSFEVTKRYLGISQDEIDKIYIDMNLF